MLLGIGHILCIAFSICDLYPIQIIVQGRAVFVRLLQKCFVVLSVFVVYRLINLTYIIEYSQGVEVGGNSHNNLVQDQQENLQDSLQQK